VEQVTVTGVAAGGDGVGRLADGRAVFVRGALPGERVGVDLVEEKARFARAELVEVLEPATGRTSPPCPLVAAGCGGCGWQHVEHDTQRELKATIVADALTRIGRLRDLPPIARGPDLPPTAYRTTVKAAVLGGSAALHVHHGDDTVALAGTGCLVAHPLVDEVLRLGRFGAATAVTVRAGAATGERLVVVDPRADDVEVPEGVPVVGGNELRPRHRVWYHEEVAGRRWRISARSFFQTRPDGAAALAGAVATAATPHLRANSQVVDLYGGVGLLAGVLADRAGVPLHLQVVEANRSAAADARVNLADVAGAKVVGVDVRRWRPSPADVVVADPSRHGLGGEVVDRIAATGAAAVVLVSCDPGSLGRDAGLLAARGHRLTAVTMVDLFPHTPHVEVVTTWERAERHPDGAPAP
jgi:23S rRNA (uracil1939-C5)-methyltransferase